MILLALLSFSRSQSKLMTSLVSMKLFCFGDNGECSGSKLHVKKTVGKVKNLSDSCETDREMATATVGVGHTRWATHGGPSDINAHPHSSHDNSFALVHNGIIENYYELKTNLELNGYKMKSETDTEVLVCLIDSLKKELNCPLEEAVRLALHEVGDT